MILVLIIGSILVIFGCWGTNASPAAKVVQSSSEGNSLQVFGLVVLLGFIAMILIISLGIK